jgi:hypothetical protein
MPQPEPVLVPRWLVIVGSVLICYHLIAVVSAALAAPSGPWPNQDGSSMVFPPQFAKTVNEQFASGYLSLMRMPFHYHFPSNRPAIPGVYFVVRLKDKVGNELGTVTVPDPNANYWVRARQMQLAQGLADDQPVQPPTGEVIAAPNQAVPTVTLWYDDGPRKQRVKDVPQHLVPRDRSMYRPSEWSLLLAQSYGRHLCRERGAASAEIVRHWKEPIPPVVMFMDTVSADGFDEIASDFGEVAR